MNYHYVGEVKMYDVERGYGTIQSRLFNEDIFVHKETLKNMSDLKAGDIVLFNVTLAPRGYIAIEIALIDKKVLNDFARFHTYEDGFVVEMNIEELGNVLILDKEDVFMKPRKFSSMKEAEIFVLERILLNSEKKLIETKK